MPATRPDYPWGTIPPADANLDNVGPWILGVVKRERERLAKAFRRGGLDDARLIKAILDDADDPAVFKWSPPTTKLDDPAPPINPKDDVLW